MKTSSSQTGPEYSAAADHSPLILVIEDHDDMRACMRDMLEFGGYRVVEACNGRQGWQVLESLENTPDLIVSDLLLSEGNALRFLQAVRNRQPWRDIPFVFVSASVDKLRAIAAVAGADRVECLPKPFSARKLLIIVSHSLQAGAARTGAGCGWR
jgi:CheY-like chemotaxis protein